MKIGTILRTGKGRVVSMCTDSSSEILGLHGRDNVIELFQINPEETIQDKVAKRLKKQKKKARE